VKCPECKNIYYKKYEVTIWNILTAPLLFIAFLLVGSLSMMFGWSDITAVLFVLLVLAAAFSFINSISDIPRFLKKFFGEPGNWFYCVNCNNVFWVKQTGEYTNGND